MGDTMNKWIETWKTVLTNPKDVFASQKKSATVMEGVKQYAIAGLLQGLLLAILGLILGTVAGGIGAGVVAALIGIVVSVIAFPIGALIGQGILYVIAKLLDGKGSFAQHYYLTSLFAVPIMVLAAVLAAIPVIGVVALLVQLYGLYLLTLALKEAHGFDTMKAVLVWLIPAILVAILVVVVGAALFSAIGLGGLAGALPMGG